MRLFCLEIGGGRPELERPGALSRFCGGLLSPLGLVRPLGGDGGDRPPARDLRGWVLSVLGALDVLGVRARRAR